MCASPWLSSCLPCLDHGVHLTLQKHFNPAMIVLPLWGLYWMSQAFQEDFPIWEPESKHLQSCVICAIFTMLPPGASGQPCTASPDTPRLVSNAASQGELCSSLKRFLSKALSSTVLHPAKFWMPPPLQTPIAASSAPPGHCTLPATILRNHSASRQKCKASPGLSFLGDCVVLSPNI